MQRKKCRLTYGGVFEEEKRNKLAAADGVKKRRKKNKKPVYKKGLEIQRKVILNH